MINVSEQQLRLFIERIETMEEEKREVAEQVKEVYNELAAEGYDKKTVRQLIRLRRKSKEAREEEEALLDTYRSALGI
jgi:uncharacterized protein (UPF0335 family)